MTFDKTNWVWMNGDVVPWNGATVHVSAHALHYGSGVFEGMRCYETENGPAVFRMDRHLERLFASAEWYGIRIPYSNDELADAVCETIRRNDFTSCYVRPICYFGSSGLALNPRQCPIEVTILAWPWGAYLGEESVERGVRVTVASWTKFHSRMLPTVAKGCGGYMNSMLAAREAADNGFDEALLLDDSGNIAEGSGENLFLVRDGRLLTNDESSSILLGITRESVIEIARDLGYEVEIRMLSLDDLRSADEAFFTGTAVEVTPIRELDGNLIGVGKRGPVTERMQRAFAAATSGRDKRYATWLHRIDTQLQLGAARSSASPTANTSPK
jgi:branched-chain amino acid aminotransferase